MMNNFNIYLHTMSANDQENKLEINSVDSDQKETLSTKNPSDKFSLLKVDDISSHDIEKDVMITNDMTLTQERRRIGYIYAFRYKDGEPRIVIGPHCNKLISFLFRAFSYVFVLLYYLNMLPILLCLMGNAQRLR